MASEENSKLLANSKTLYSKTEKISNDGGCENDCFHQNSNANIEAFFSRNETLSSGYTEIGENDTSRRSWKIGLIMAILSGVLCTASNFFVQYFQVDAIEMLLVRSGLQSIVLGAVVTLGREQHIRNQNEMSICSTRIWIGVQAVIGSVLLLLNFACLQYMPIGDALTLVFTEPLFTILLSFILYRTKIGFTKGIFCICLIAGLLLSVQPPFLFSNEVLPNSTEELSHRPNLLGIQTPIISLLKKPSSNSISSEHEKTFIEIINHNIEIIEEKNDIQVNLMKDEEDEISHSHDPTYYIGVGLAVGCAICGALRNVIVNKKCAGISSTLLLSQCGIAGFIVSIIGCFIDDSMGEGSEKGSLILLNLRSLSFMDWIVMFMISTVGILSYFALMEALFSISPTSVSVLRSLEIVLAYICQVLFIGVYPDVIGIGGSLLVMASVIGIAIEERNHIEM